MVTCSEPRGEQPQEAPIVDKPGQHAAWGPVVEVFLCSRLAVRPV